MYIYADVLLIINIAMNGLILILTAWAAGIAGKAWRIVAAAAAGSFYALGGLVAGDAWPYAPPFKLAAAAGMVWMAFGPCSWRFLLLCTAYLYIVSLLLGGAVLGWLLLAGQSGPGAALPPVTWRDLVAGGIVALILVGFVWRRLAAGLARRPLLFSLVLGYRGQEITIPALLDTGNHLYTAGGRRPVVLVERHGLAPLLAPAVNEYLARTPPTAWVADLNRCPDSEWLARVQIIPCRAALGGGLLLGFRPDRLAVLTADGVAIAADAVVGIHSGSLSAGVYAALLHPAIMREFDGKEGRDICA